jgi:hypothetical protein
MNNVGTTIYNGMIAPLLPFAIRGTLWYRARPTRVGPISTGKVFRC